MQNRAARATDPDITPGARLASAMVSLLFFAPLLGLAWWASNLAIASNGDTDRQIPVAALLTSIGVAAVLGWFAARASATVFGWLAEVFERTARFWGRDRR